jgi:CRISPR/Cas system-associated exonuclease Cas4 (RecB family)
LPEKTSLLYLKGEKMLENVLKTDNLERVKTKLEAVARSILNEEFEAKPEKGACYSCAFKSICDFVESD